MKLYRTLALIATGIAVIATATIALANTGSGLTTTILGHRATLSRDVEVEQSGIDFQTEGPTDALVQTITFQPHGTSGWHFHPGMVLVVVESGTVTTHNAECETKTYGPHQAFVEKGTRPFMVSNESSTENATVYATIVVPAGSAFRIESAPPPCA